MARFKVRHATIQYRSKNDLGQDTYEVAFRGTVVELPDGESTDRLKALGAVVPEDEELPRPGRLGTLPDTATDAEITSWVVAATADEVKMLIAERPVMATRIESAWASVQERFEEQAKHLGSVPKEKAVETVGEGSTPAPQASSTPTPAVNNPGEFDADKVVAGSAKSVTDFVSDNPAHAAAILEAENRRGEDPRVSVVRAVEAARAQQG